MNKWEAVREQRHGAHPPLHNPPPLRCSGDGVVQEASAPPRCSRACVDQLMNGISLLLPLLSRMDRAAQAGQPDTGAPPPPPLSSSSCWMSDGGILK